jgi:hypothetical protein
MTGDRIFSRVSTWCHSQKLSNYAKWESPHRLDTYRETFTEHDAYPRTCADWNRVQISAKDVSTFRRVPGGRTRDDANFDFASENMCEFVDSVCGVFSSEDALARWTTYKNLCALPASPHAAYRRRTCPQRLGGRRTGRHDTLEEADGPTLGTPYKR